MKPKKSPKISPPHLPVLLTEFLDQFSGLHIKTFFDGTLGAGGHAEALLTAHDEIDRYVGCDRDPSALKIAEKRLEPWKEKLELVHGNFCDCELPFETVDGAFFDLGVSSMQLDQMERGFSFRGNHPLDMRMNPEDPLSAKDVVNTFSEEQLGEIIRDYGEERRWRACAQAIVAARPLETTKDLADAIVKTARGPRKKLHPATLVFQAIRIYVNSELTSAKSGIERMMMKLRPGGLLGVISFHSLEDRIVKNLFRDAAMPKRNLAGQTIGDPDFKVVTKKPIAPSEKETNPRARSAKMRFIMKL